jgi:hypothetical protein
MGGSLSTFLAFFTTVATAALMIPVAEAMSQWKWNWYRNDRPLSDFQVFDGASRNVFGSVAFLRQFTYK